MITIKIDVTQSKLTPAQEDALRHHMSHSVVQWAFAMAETFGRQNGLDFGHKDVVVNGQALLVPNQPGDGSEQGTGPAGGA